MSTPPRLAAQAPADRKSVLADFGGQYAANGFIGFVFAATAPLAIILSVGSRGGLSEAELASWIFGVFFVNGAITMALCWWYRQPLVLFWTIPGTVLVGPALQHLTFPQVIGAYYVAGMVIVALGALGWVRRAMSAIPMPIVMAMVAGVFLRFGLGVVQSLHDDFALAGPMVAVWLVLTALPAWGRRLPPLIGALIAGVIAAIVLGRTGALGMGALEIVRPVIQKPAWSWPAMVELVLPLMITVLVVQNGQGVAVLRAAGHEPPINMLTVACGIGSLLSAMVGAVSSCLAGPTNAIVSASGERRRHYTAGLFTGLLAMVFGLFAPAFTRLMLHLPPAYIATVAGLAMLRVLQGAFKASFGGSHTLGALVALLVTVADKPLFGVGSAFWGLAAGIALSWLLERDDFRPSPMAAD